MQKKLEVLNKTNENSLFSIDRFSFELTETVRGNMIKYSIELSIEGYTPLDVRFLLEEIDPDLQFILDVPAELTYYIKEYEEDKNPENESLFHDLRTKYIEFIKREDDRLEAAESIFIVGFSIAKEKVYLVIKTFSLNLLSAYLEKIKKYCGENEIGFTTAEDIRWLELQQYMVRKQENTRNHQCEEFLEKTLVNHHFSRFMKIFKKIDRDGYFKKSFYKEVMFQEKELANGNKIPVPINQISRFFSPYWKYSIRANQKEIICLHDEMPDDEKIEEYVYTFKPSLLGYYLKNWFEDFTVEILERTKFSPYTVTHVMPGARFNFFCDGDERNVREIDAAVSIENRGISKLIAIECKKTLSSKEIQTTNKKCREKVINSGNHIFDAFVHIGCFSNEIVFEKTFEGTKLNYNQGIISGSDENLDAPFYVFDIASKEDFEKKLFYVMKDIFTNW